MRRSATATRDLAGRSSLIAALLLALGLAGCATVGEHADPQADAEEASAHQESAGSAARPAKPRSTTVSQARRPTRPEPARTEAASPSADEDQELDDLLARLRKGFALPTADRPEIKQQARWFADNQAHLDRILDRARPYLPHVADEVEARGLPSELAFLPVIESAFDPFAYSHGRAAGLWQIIPGTGRRLGLKQSWWYDGRRDVVESTRAALDYLEYLAGMFEGDWLLAVAAYNAGEGTIGRAVRNNQAAGKPTDFWHLRLPAETRAYVPRLLGLVAVLSDPDYHAVELPAIPNEPVFTSVEIDGQIDLAVAAELAGIDLELLQALNPGFNRWATDPDGPHRLQLPLDAAEPFSQAIAELPPEALVRWHRHEVRPGDTLGAIARRYGTTVAALQSANNLSGTNIRVGSQLMVPASTRDAGAAPLSAANRPGGAPSRERAGRVRTEYTVRSGDSLWSIARRHGVGVRDLAAWNGMTPDDTLSVGRTLVVWQPAQGAAHAAGQGAAPTAEPLIRRVNYTVRQGDSLSRIAANFRVSVEDIRRWNNLDTRRHLQPGQRLILHVDVTR